MTSTEPTTDWAARYAAVQSLIHDPGALIPGCIVLPRWIDAHTFWYPRALTVGSEVRIVDARDGGADLVVPLTSVIAALQVATGIDTDITADDVVPVDASRDIVTVTYDHRSWRYDIARQEIAEDGSAPSAGDQVAPAPDGTTRMVLRGHNLILDRGGEESVLTTDGDEDFAYASVPLAARPVEMFARRPPQGIWSPDGRFFFTLRTDSRQVGSVPIMEFLPKTGVRPQIRTNRTSLPGDENITEFVLLVVDTEGGLREIDHPPLPAVRMNDTPFNGGMAWWSADSRTAYFVAIDRGELTVRVVACDVATGATRVVFTEEADAPIDLSLNVYTPALIRHLPARNQLVWYSERSGRGHLYLYDLGTGEVVRQLTDGDWLVRELLGVDGDEQTLFFLAAGIGSASTPYQTRPCSVVLDDGAASVRVLRDGDGNHQVFRAGDFTSMVTSALGAPVSTVSGFSPGADYFVETVSSFEALPATTLCDRDGNTLRELDRGDPAALPEGWQWPIPVRATAADGRTDVYGLLFLPVDYDPDSTYPVIDAIYGGPQVHNVPDGAFADGLSAAKLLEAAAYSQLGAFALILDGRGTTERDRAFHLASWRRVHHASDLEDHMAAIRQLGTRYPAMDLERVGITGFSGGGYATALASFRYGDFFKVAVAGGGNYDQALFWNSWGERYHGMYDEEHYAAQAAKTYAAQASGKILFIHGLRDFGCHPAALFQMLQALVDHGKDYDLVLLPAVGHALTGYGERRRLDYFVTHLFGAEPPVLDRPFTLASDELVAEISENGPSIAEEYVDEP